MKHLLLFVLLISNLSSFSKLDTSKVIIGTWKLKAIKTEASLRSLDDQVETKSKISSDSLLKIIIKKDSIYIIRESYRSSKDTFAYTYTLKTDTSRYSNAKMDLVLLPSKSRLKGLRKRHRKTQKELGFTITRLTNSQLIIQDAFFNNFPTNPFSNFTYITYYFEKVNPNSVNEFTFKGKWYFNHSSPTPLESVDTLKLSRDSTADMNNYKFSLNFNINTFKNNDLKFKKVIRPKPKPVNHEVLNGIYVRSHYFLTKWEIKPNSKTLTIQLNSKSLTFSYTFINNQLHLVKNGS